MATISVSTQADLINSANFFGVALYDASAPTVLLENQIPVKPYSNPIQTMFAYNCIFGHQYIIRLWESATGTPDGLQRNLLSLTCNGQQVRARMPEYLEADVTPAAFVSGVDTYTDTSWIGWTGWFERKGQGTMTPDNVGNTNPDYSYNAATGKWDLLAVGDKFAPNEKFTRFFDVQVITAPSGSPSNPIGSGQIITVDTTFDNSYLNSGLLIEAIADSIVCKLPSLAGVMDYDFIYINSEGGNHKNAVFTADGTDKINCGGLKSRVILGQSETMAMYKAFGRWNLFTDLPGVKAVGELLYSYLATEINTLPCFGQTVSRVTYARLWDWVQALGSSTVSDVIWSNVVVIDGVSTYPYQGFFTPGDGSTTFRLPLISNMMLKAKYGTQGGTHENWMSVAHDHSTPHSASSTGGGTGYVGGSAGVQDNANPTGAMKFIGTGTLITAVGSQVKTESILTPCLIRI